MLTVKTNLIRLFGLPCLALFTAFIAPSRAAVPSLTNFQGIATDAGGHRLSGPLSLSLKYYDDPTAGNLLLTEEQAAVAATNGVFNTQLGSGTLTPGAETTLAGVFQNHDGVWIQIAVNADPPMSPRAQVVAVPFALRAATADTLEGISASSLMTTDATPQTKTGALTIAPSTGTASALVAKGNGSNAALEISNGPIKISGATPTAFTHIVSAANTSGYTTTIDNPLANGDPNAILLITRVAPLGSVSASPESISFNGTHWQINNTNQARSFVAGERFNVLVIKQG